MENINYLKDDLFVEDLINRLEYYIEQCQQIIVGNDPKTGKLLLTEIRKNLKKDVNDLSLKNVEDRYEGNRYFNTYRFALLEANGKVHGNIKENEVVGAAITIKKELNDPKRTLEKMLDKDM